MPKYTKPRKTWQYSNEFKVKAVLLSLIEGVQVKEVADILDTNLTVHSNVHTLYL